MSLSREHDNQTVASYLVNVSGSIVEHSEHRDQAVGEPVGARNVGSLSPDAVNIQPDASGRLGDECRLLQRVVDALDRVVRHCQQKAAGQLRPGEE